MIASHFVGGPLRTGSFGLDAAPHATDKLGFQAGCKNRFQHIASITVPSSGGAVWLRWTKLSSRYKFMVDACWSPALVDQTAFR